MNKRGIFLPILLLFLFFSPIVPVLAEEAEDIEVANRLEKAQMLGVMEWVDEEGYLKESYFEGKTYQEIAQLGVDDLIRIMTEEEIGIYTENLNSGISMYLVTNYQLISGLDPETNEVLYTGRFEVDGIAAFCIQRSQPAPGKGAQTGQWIAVENEKLRKVLYYGYNGPEAKGYSFVATAMAAAEANGDGDNYLGRVTLEALLEYPAPPDDFYVWKVHTSGGQKQDLAFYTRDRRGMGRVRKRSSRTNVTDGNAIYSLEGAVFGIYTDEACTEEVAQLVTGPDGYTEEIPLKRASYYVKELAAPEGFELYEKIKMFEVQDNETTTVTIADKPKMFRPDIFIQKVDMETGKAIAQGSGSLEDAHFSVRFYARKYEDGVDPGSKGIQPDAEWIVKTDADGRVRLDNKHLVSGDEFYTDEAARAIFPLGTVTIREIKAPNGYRVCEDVFVFTLSAETEKIETILVQEPSIQAELLKYRAGTNVTLTGAVFEHVLPDGTSEEKTTDEQGRIVWKGLMQGKHQIREVTAPEGFLVNRNVVEFEVLENGEIILFATGDEVSEEIAANITEEGNLKIRFDNKAEIKLPYTGASGAVLCGLFGSTCCFAALKRKEENLYEK